MTEPDLNRSGIYRITCASNRRIYVGSAINIRKRWKLHRTHMRMGVHHNRPIQSAWEKYGEASFTFDVLEFCDQADLSAVEQKWLDATQAYVRTVGFNVLTKAHSSIGFRHSDETRAKLSGMATARDHNHLRELNEARRGKPGKKGVSGWTWTDEHRAKASESRKGRQPWNKGIPHTDEAKRKISLGGIGLNREISEESRDEIKMLRASGMTYKAIAAATGVSLAQCHKIAHDNTGRYTPLGVQRSKVEKIKAV